MESTIKFPLQISNILVKTEGTHNQALWDAKANTNRFWNTVIILQKLLPSTDVVDCPLKVWPSESKSFHFLKDRPIL